MEGVGRREREKERVWRVHAKIKTVSEARFEEKQRDRTENGNEKGIGIGRTPLFLLYESRSFPPPLPCVTAWRGMTFVPDYLSW